MSKVVKVVINKPDPQSIVGLSFGDKALTTKGADGKTATIQVPVISKVDPEGLCAGTFLEVGQRILSINGIACRGKDDAYAMLRMGVGELTILAGPRTWVAATVTKASKDTKVGFSIIKKEDDDKVVVVSKVNPDGLFAKTNLKVGMIIHSVLDHEEVGNLHLDDIKALLADAVGSVTVLAEEPAPPKEEKRNSLRTSATAATSTTNNGSMGGSSRRSITGSQKTLGDSIRNIGNEIKSEMKAQRRRSSLKDMDVPKPGAK